MSYRKGAARILCHWPSARCLCAALCQRKISDDRVVRRFGGPVSFRIAGAIAQVDRKFTKKEGKPFAVVWLEDLTGTLEVVLWNETYTPVASDLELGKVIAIRGKLDRRDDTVRATAQKVRLLTPDIVARMKEREEESRPADAPAESVAACARGNFPAHFTFQRRHCRRGTAHGPTDPRFFPGRSAGHANAHESGRPAGVHRHWRSLPCRTYAGDRRTARTLAIVRPAGGAPRRRARRRQKR